MLGKYLSFVLFPKLAFFVLKFNEYVFYCIIFFKQKLEKIFSNVLFVFVKIVFLQKVKRTLLIKKAKK